VTLRHLRFAPALAAVVIFGCSKGNVTPTDAGQSACTTLADCTGNGGKQVCLNSVCVNTCSSNADCSTSGVPNAVCEEAVCLAPACGNDAQCGTGQACLNGACRTAPAASQVASCDVSPNPGDVRVGSTLQLRAVLRDADGKPLHFGGVTWASTAGGTVDANGLLTASAAGADITVTATAGTKNCTSTVHPYGAVAAGMMRVTVINMHTKEPVPGATVLVDTTTLAPTASDGTATTSATAGAHDVHVFAKGFNYTSFLATASTDLLVPLAPWIPIASRSGFSSHMCDSKSDDPNTGDATKPQCPSPEGEFQPLQDQGEAVHLAFFGSSIANSLLDLSVDTLVGPMHTVHVALPGTTTAKDLNLPYGLVLGIGTNFFGTNDPRVFADGGVRALWGIGGNINLAKVITILSPLLQPNATVDIGTLLPQLLGFFGRLEAGAVVGVKAPPNATAGGAPSFTTQPVELTTPMRLRVDATSPKLPKLDGAYVDGVLAMAGSMDFPMGFIPLGITAGLSAKDNAGGVLDPTCDTTTSAGNAPCDTNKIPLKFAPENGGSEGSKIGVALLALNFGGLSPGSATHVAVSGQVAVFDKVDYVAPGLPATAVAPPDFMALPASNSITVTKATRNVSITGGDADPGVKVYRFELENAARQNWNLWTPPIGAAPASVNFKLPDPGFSHTLPCDPTASLCDPFDNAVAAGATVATGPTARLLALEFTDASATSDSLETFSSALRLDEIGPALKAFTALQVNVQ
jgi:hypothetical protein